MGLGRGETWGHPLLRDLIGAEPALKTRQVGPTGVDLVDVACHAEVVKSPWKTLVPLVPGAEYLVLASSIPPRSITSTWKMFRGSRVVRRQLLATDGVVGFSMLAEPLRKHYATLSVWRDEEALDAFARTDPHAGLMAEMAPMMNEPKFVRWTIAGGDGNPSWNDALDRLR